jgi:CheY-like chemotaxis protein
VAQWVDVLKVIIPLAWPLLIAVLLWHLLPTIKKVIDSRAFTLKFAGIEVTTQEATDQIKAQLQDLKDQVLALRKIASEPAEGVSAPIAEEVSAPIVDTAPRSILWVDDRPSNNAIEISQLEERGYKVITALSTNEAMATLARERVGVIISDMGRREEGRYVAQAWLVLLRAARASGYKQPFIIYTSSRYAEKNDTEVKASGGDGATASPVKLLEWIESHLAGPRQTSAQNS